MKNEKGFTLIELLVVIAIIGLLSTLAVVSLSSARTKARDAKRQADLKTLQSAIEMFITDSATGVAPGFDADPTWAELSTSLINYMPQGAPQDPSSTRSMCYCVDGGTNPTSSYLIAVALENVMDISGDIDTSAAGGALLIGTKYTFASECICNTGTTSARPTLISCVDTSAGQVHATTGSTLCLGVTP